ncbi:alpha/beta hydrolase [Actinophytocola sediminis]
MRGLLAVGLAVATAATVAGSGVAAGEPSSTPRWGPCPPDVTGAGLECATLQVPLDYRNQDGPTIEVAISRLASANPAKRQGVLLLNPGGPGGTGLSFPAALAAEGLPQDVLDAYDVIGFDPRGVGHSTPVTCDLTPAQAARGTLPPYAHTAADVVETAEAAKAVAEQCGTSATAPLLPHITTANTARDLDRIRAALGEPAVSYLGYSYGTYLGAVYATLFPQRGERIVLDSNLPPGGLDATAARLYARGFHDRFPDFARFAAAHPEYGLGTTPEQVTATFFDLAAKLDRAPSEGIDGSLFRAITLGMLYRDARMPLLAEYWRAWHTGQPLPAEPLAIPEDNLLAGFNHVSCNDSDFPESVRGYQRDVAVDRIRYPMLGAMAANIRPCAFWPVDPVEPPVRIGDRGPSNVLMTHFDRDPGTPLVGARMMRAALGDRARLVTVGQGGHGVYLFGENTCADNEVTTFLVTGDRTDRDLRCAAETP